MIYLSSMKGCGGRGLVVVLIACVVDPSACFLYGACSRTRPRVTRRPTASCSPRSTPSAEVEHVEQVEQVERRPKDLDQDSTPLVDALAEAASNVRSPLFYPGHKMGRYGGAALLEMNPTCVTNTYVLAADLLYVAKRVPCSVQSRVRSTVCNAHVVISNNSSEVGPPACGWSLPSVGSL